MRALAWVILFGFALPAAFGLYLMPGGFGDVSDASTAFGQLLQQDLAALIPFLLVGLAGALVALRARQSVAPALGWIADHPRWVAVATTALCALLAVTAYARHPLAMDEFAPTYQARLFAAGTITARYAAPALEWVFYPIFLDQFVIVSRETGQVMSGYWPGWALALAPFQAVGVAYLLNPLLAGGVVLLLRQVAMRVTDGDRVASGAAVALLVCSPAFVVNGASFYSMNAHLFANLLFVSLVMSPTFARLVAAGAVGAWALSLHNPLPHLLFAWPWWLLLVRGGGGWRRILALAVGYVPLALLLVVGWNLEQRGLRGAPTVSPFALPGLALVEVRLLNLGKLILWAPFGLVPLAALGAWRTRRLRAGWPWIAAALSTVAGYLLVPVDQGHGWGYRYFHSAYMTLPLLAAQALRPAVTGRVERIPEHPLLRCAAVWSLGSVLVLLPLRAAQVETFIRVHLAQIAPTPAHLECVHFLRATRFYAQDLIRNDPWLRDQQIFLTDHGRVRNTRLLSAAVPGAQLAAQTSADTVYCSTSLDGLRQLLLTPAAELRP